MDDPLNDVTEAEAKQRWCPQIRDGYEDNGSSHNRFGTNSPQEHDYPCIGSRCMMWRWSTRDLGRCGLAR